MGYGRYTLDIQGIPETNRNLRKLQEELALGCRTLAREYAQLVADGSKQTIATNRHPSGLWRKKGGGKLGVRTWRVKNGKTGSDHLVSFVVTSPGGEFGKSASIAEYMEHYKAKAKTPGKLSRGHNLKIQLDKTFGQKVDAGDGHKGRIAHRMKRDGGILYEMELRDWIAKMNEKEV